MTAISTTLGCLLALGVLLSALIGALALLRRLAYQDGYDQGARDATTLGVGSSSRVDRVVDLDAGVACPAVVFEISVGEEGDGEDDDVYDARSFDVFAGDEPDSGVELEVLVDVPSGVTVFDVGPRWTEVNYPELYRWVMGWGLLDPGISFVGSGLERVVEVHDVEAGRDVLVRPGEWIVRGSDDQFYVLDDPPQRGAPIMVTLAAPPVGLSLDRGSW